MAQTQQFRGVARSKGLDREGNRTYTYHNTVVVRVLHNGYVQLDSGGYRTPTTKLAMNQASNEAGFGFQVVQERGSWYVVLPSGAKLDYYDKMIVGTSVRSEVA